MSTKSQLSTLIFLLLFLFVEIADARLVRSSGRGTFSGNYSEAIYFVENQYINDIGITNQITSVPNISRARGGGASGINAVPNECLVGRYTVDEKEAIEDDLEQALFEIDTDLASGFITQAEADVLYAEQDAIAFDLYGESCVWEFEQGDPFNMFGGFNFYYGSSADINYEVVWNIAGTDYQGSINTSGNIAAPNGINTINNGWITLDTPQIFSLAPGEYDVFAKVFLTSSAGQFFYETNKPGEEVQIAEKCVSNLDEVDAYYAAFDLWQNYQWDLEDFNNGLLPNPPVGPEPPFPGNIEPPIERCAYTSLDGDGDFVSAPSSFFSEIETLRILPASIVAAPASSPAPFGIFILGLSLLLLRTKKRFLG